MKKIITFFCLTIFFFSCSDDTASEDSLDLRNDFPIISEIQNTLVETGDIIQIDGNFNTNDAYIIIFNENIVARIIETKPEYIKVEVPEGAETGDVTFTFEGQTKFIGTVEINQPIQIQTKLFGFNSIPSPYIAELNSENGTEISTLADLPKENYNYFDFVYLKESNEIIAFFNTSSPFSSGYFLINVTTKEKKEINIPDNKSYDLLNVNSRLFGYNSIPSPYIAELNSENGTEISTLADLPKENYNYFDFVYLKESNEIIAFFNTSSPFSSGYFLINVTTKEKKEINILDNKSYNLLNVNSRLYGFNSIPSPYIAELNSENGTEISTLTDLPKENYNYFDFVYLKESNEIIAFFNTSSPFSSGYFLINVTTKEKKEINIPDNKSYNLFSY